MNAIIKHMPDIKKFNDYIFDIKKGKTPIMLSGLTDSGKVHLSYATRFYSEKPICIITYNELQAKKIIKDLAFFNEKIDFFPKYEIINFDYLAESRDVFFDRMSVLNNILKNKSKIIVTTIEAVMQKMVSKEKLYNNMISLKIDDTVDLEKLKNKLISLGYERYDLIDEKGQFSVRGGIIDIAVSSTIGVRIELWGDKIDSIRKFNIMSQRSTEKIDFCEIFPVTEQVKSEDEEENDKTSSFMNYLSDNFVLFLDEIEKIKSRVDGIIKNNEGLIKDLLEKQKKVPSDFIKSEDYLHFLDIIKERQTIYLEKQDLGIIDRQSMHAKRNGYSFSYREVNFFRSSMDLLFQKLQKAINTSKQTIVLRWQSGKLQENLWNFA